LQTLADPVTGVMFIYPNLKHISHVESYVYTM